METKAQVSIFVIFSIVILVAAVLGYYLNTESHKEEIAPGVFISAKDIPTQIDPVNAFVTQCLDDTAVEGLILIGEHGGYIGIDNPKLSKQSFRPNDDPTESDAVAFAPGSDFKIPYWWYLESSNNCEGTCRFASKRPPLKNDEDSIERQLDRYIEKKLPDCIDSFKSLEEQGFEINELSAIKASSEITKMQKKYYFLERQTMNLI